MMIIEYINRHIKQSIKVLIITIIIFINTLVILRRYELCFEIWMDTNKNNNSPKVESFVSASECVV